MTIEHQKREIRTSLQAWMRAAIARGNPARLCRDVVEEEALRIGLERNGVAPDRVAFLMQFETSLRKHLGADKGAAE